MRRYAVKTFVAGLVLFANSGTVGAQSLLRFLEPAPTSESAPVMTVAAANLPSVITPHGEPISLVSANSVYVSDGDTASCSACGQVDPVCGCQTNGCGAHGYPCGCGSGCGCSNGDDEAWTLFPENCHGITLTGWAQGGYHDESNGLFNSHPNKFNAHQIWLALEKQADTSRCWFDWGFRFDVLYGVDAQDTQAFGNPPNTWDFENGFDHGRYGWAIPQAYGELAWGDWSILIGHFYTIVGYEVVPAPDNFFYSHALTMYNSEPFTHTGVLATYSLCDEVEIYTGWTLGWDTGFERLGDGNNFLGGLGVSVSDDVKVTYVATAGDMGDYALPLTNPSGRGDGYTHSLVLDISLTENLQYVLQSDFVSLSNGPGTAHNDEVGVNQYFIYTLNDCWSLGSRFEWWKSDRGFDYGGQATVPFGTHSYFEATTGLNYKPHGNLTLRPEFRYDWSPASNYDQSILGVDVIVTF